MTYICPVCGYPGLTEPSHNEYGGGSFDICPSCGTQFGYQDSRTPHAELRRRWVERGAPWHSKTRHPPAGWDPVRQLRKAGHAEAAAELAAARGGTTAAR